VLTKEGKKPQFEVVFVFAPTAGGAPGDSCGEFGEEKKRGDPNNATTNGAGQIPKIELTQRTRRRLA